MWTKDLDRKALVRIAEVWTAVDEAVGPHDIRLSEAIASILRIQVGLTLGRRVDPEDLYGGQYKAEWLLDIIAAVPIAVRQVAEHKGEIGDAYTEVVNEILREHRVAYKFVEGELISFESDELLQEVVEPTLRLLVGERFKAAHASYLDALKEIADGKPDDAITDAGRALQQALEALGCEGDVLSKLIASAKEKDLFKTHDQQLHEAFILISKWAASERNKVGDAHTDGGATVADAWLIVHVVGALIVRLADPAPRGTAG